ncbi:Na+/H+ antiporter NhaA type [hydrothermal vent metagenome]|uniref:Na+/H+ antiporter NhaA type n=1 Tax=hydrothermal vent metagenome TaxID=652676 RepID=A0A3B1DGT4_9ZZZZ
MPVSLKVFLTSLAIADDLGALLVIAIFYTDDLATNYLLYAGLVTLAMFGLNMLRVRTPIPYLLFGMVLWYFVYKSGVHATIAGVLAAMTIPASARVGATRYIEATRESLDTFERHSKDPDKCVKTNPEQRAAVWAIHKNSKQVMPMLHRLEDTLHPWSVFLIIPIFALANAGVELSGSIGETAGSRNTLGVVFGLVIGKPVGIFLFSLLAVKFGIAALPRGVTWKHIFGVGCLGGIGFTMALFIANLAFAGDQGELNHAKIGILFASLVSAIVGLAILMTCKAPQDTDHAHNE